MEYWTICCGALNAQLNLQSVETKALQGRQITIASACKHKQDLEIYLKVSTFPLPLLFSTADDLA